MLSLMLAWLLRFFNSMVAVDFKIFYNKCIIIFPDYMEAIMEIERKYLIDEIPFDLKDYSCKVIEQGYLNTDPVVRVRRSNDKYILTYKGSGLMVREECNLPLNEEAYRHLVQKADGIIISKKRYLIPLTDRLTIELDIFEGDLAPLKLAEVEFETKEEAESFLPPKWFGKDVTFSSDYHNSTLSRVGLPT